MWKEVIPNKETHEDPVINAPLEFEGKRQAGHRQLSGEVLNTAGIMLKHEALNKKVPGRVFLRQLAPSRDEQHNEHRTSRSTHSRMNMNSCSDTGIESANWSC